MTITLVAGEDSVSVDPRAGGRLTSLVAGGAQRLLTEPPESAPPEEHMFMYGSFLMAPWVGRLAGNSISWEGEDYEFRPNFRGQAIHGLVVNAQWTAEQPAPDTAELACALDREQWPFGGVVRQRIRLAPGLLELTAAIEAAERSMPVSLGWHPWFKRPERGDAALRVAAGEVLELDDALVPTGERLPVEGDTDLRPGPPLGDRFLDHVYVAAEPPGVIGWPDLTMHVDWSVPIETVVVHTPEQAFTLEPQTAWPNAPALTEKGVEGTGMISLGPAAVAEARTTWSWSPPAS
jgi:aldose 1-epimerase